MTTVDEQPDEGDKLEYNDFLNRMKIVSLKGSEKYKFLLNSGQAFKDCLMEVFKSVWLSENIPE